MAAAAVPTESPSRGRPRDPDVDDGILRAAADLVAERGFEGLTMDGVAKRAGVAKASVYRRFPCKVDLIVAVCHFAAPSQAEAPDTGTLRGDLAFLSSSLSDTISRSELGGILPAMVAEAAVNQEVREALRAFSSGRRSTMNEVLARAVERGELSRAVDLGLVADQLVGTVIYRRLFSTRPTDPEALNALVEQTIAGLATFGSDSG